MFKPLKLIFLMAFLFSTNLVYAADLTFKLQLFDAVTGKNVSSTTQAMKGMLYITNNSPDPVTVSKFQFYSLSMSRAKMGPGYWKNWLFDNQNDLEGVIPGYTTIARSLPELNIKFPSSATDTNPNLFPEKYSTYITAYVTTPTMTNQLKFLSWEMVDVMP